MTLILTPGQQHESTVFVPLMQAGAVKRAGRGRPKHRPKRVSGDKGYSYPHIRQYLRQHGIRYTIPRRKDQHHGGAFDRRLYRSRNRVERLINKLKHFRRLATRYEKRAENFRAMWVIGAILLWLRFANTT